MYMLGYLPRRIGTRAIGALVALAISGAPRLAAAVRTGTVHVCQCRAHGERHRCACPICAEQARRARRSAIGKLPACHQRLALEELAREEERERSAGATPCLKPSCGFDDPQGSPPAPESFFAPRSIRLAPPFPAGSPAPASDAAREAPAVPEVPPPIRGR